MLYCLGDDDVFVENLFVCCPLFNTVLCSQKLIRPISSPEPDSELMRFQFHFLRKNDIEYGYYFLVNVQIALVRLTT